MRAMRLRRQKFILFFDQARMLDHLARELYHAKHESRTINHLLKGSPEDAAKAKFEDRELLPQFQEVEHLPEKDKTVVKKLLDAFLTKKQLQSLAR